eukprot:Phypoly_transcript_02759.p1 GENE.Phypoly_transcript_02759~~Phypoly_transcript_02759.p1  ORF type:complete len:884 (+),score=93.67 Phypoly_transcript_02759:214-2652(+)
MNIVGTTSVYINLADAISLASLQANGGVQFSITTSFAISINEFYFNNTAQINITDANLQVQTALITNQAELQLIGNANFSASNFTESGGRVLLLDTSILQGDYVTLDSINATQHASFVGSSVTLLEGYIVFSCPVNISALTVRKGTPTIFGGYIGEVLLSSGVDLYAYNDITVANLTLESDSLFFGAGNFIFEGLILGVGSFYFFDSVVLIGTNDTQTNLQSIEVQISGVTNATFYNVEFGKLTTPPTGNIPPNVTLYLYGASFSVSTSFMCNIYATDLVFHGVSVNITGTVNGTGGLLVMGGSQLNITKIHHHDGEVGIYGPVFTQNLAVFNSSLSIGAEIYGTTNLTKTHIQAQENVFFYGGLSLISCDFSLSPDQSMYVSDDVYAYGFSTLSGNITANSFTLHDSQLQLQGSLAAPTIIFRNSIFFIQNETFLNCHGFLIETSIISISAPLTVNGNLILHSFDLTSTSNQTLQVNGSVYSTGNSSISSTINLVSTSFTHVGSSFSLQGTITSTTIGFANVDLTIMGPTTLYGNISMVASVIGLHSPLVIQGVLLFRASLQAPMLQTLVVTTAVISGDTCYIYENIRLYTPSYSQTAGTLHLSGQLTANSILVAKGAVLSTKLPTVIYGDIHVMGGLLEFHASTNITGSLLLEETSQTMLYNTNPLNYPIMHVDGKLYLDGDLIYWITPAPKLNTAITFKVITYSSDLNGKFATYDSYAPNIKMIKFDLRYKNKEISLVYNPSKSLGVGSVVGIVFGVVGVVLVALIAGLFYYRRYHKRQEYTSIERFEEEVNKYLISNTPTNINNTNSQ